MQNIVKQILKKKSMEEFNLILNSLQTDFRNL